METSAPVYSYTVSYWNSLHCDWVSHPEVLAYSEAEVRAWVDNTCDPMYRSRKGVVDTLTVEASEKPVEWPYVPRF